ncbi:hypothetical protein EUTSA_v10026822mg [Eutrema salsugineum]|uniref:Uncharacterized protein n=1 Tax=Eutrema salsugineum TaxID=72664 RepID=V4LX85_EUTSA|nr:hypothetical protein EUTSA_v10026822mg [Eutrema salsugineum]
MTIAEESHQNRGKENSRAAIEMLKKIEVSVMDQRQKDQKNFRDKLFKDDDTNENSAEQKSMKLHSDVWADFVVMTKVDKSGIETVVLEKMNLDSILDYRGLCSVLLDLRGNIKDLEVLLRDGFEQKLLQKIMVEVLPEWCTKDERQVASMNWLESKAVKDLQPKQLGGSVLLEGYL